MKTVRLTIISLLLMTKSYGQDGSDIRYFKPFAIDKSILGQFVQFDFFARSFGGLHLDTVIINIDEKAIKFKERRKDDGFNNWFMQQYLQSIEQFGGLNIRITQFKLDKITLDKFFVTMFVDYVDKDKKTIPNKSRQIEYQFNKKDITEVLVKSKQL